MRIELDPEEAHRELGLEFPAGPVEVRAAYLKLLKVRKPDRDPDGFQRLRAAYEALQHFDPAAPPPPMSRAREPLRPEPAWAVVQQVAPELEVQAESGQARLKRQLNERLDALKDTPFSLMERINLIDALYQRYPDDPDLIEMLVLQLLEGDLEDPAAEVLKTALRELKGPAAVRLGRFMLGRLPHRCSVHLLRNMPDGLGTHEHLGIAEALLNRHREPTEAAEVLRKVFLRSSEGELVPHSERIFLVIMSIANFGFLIEAFQLARDFQDRAANRERSLAREWLKLDALLPPPAMKQLSRAFLTRWDYSLRVEFDLPPHAMETMRRSLAEGAPTLCEALRHRFPHLIQGPKPSGPPPLSPGPGARPSALGQESVPPTGTPIDVVMHRELGRVRAARASAILMAIGVLLLCFVVWLFWRQ